MAGFISEWWPGSNRNGGRHQIGIPGRNASEFARHFRNLNLNVEALFPSSEPGNQTIAHWRELIQRGFPFVKAKALRLPGAEDWRRILEAQGYDARIAEQTLAIIEENDARPAQLPSP